MRKNILLSLSFIPLALASSPALAEMAAVESNRAPANPQIDYQGFLQLTSELATYRQTRLVTLDDFKQLSSRADALILDTRSAAAFELGHIEGAINLPFSDFTEQKLAKVVGDKNRPILIYCNNNFRDNIAPIVRKSAPLALNIPTFINLYGYGYENIYELNDVVTISDPRISWVGLSISESS